MALSILVILLKITCVLLIALCATLAMQRASAGSRHLVWLLSLAALLVVPAVATWAPLEVAVLPQANGMGGLGEMGKMGGLNAVNAPSRPATPATSAPAVTGPPIQPIQPILPILFGIWGVVAGLLAIRLLLGALAVRRIVRRARPLDDARWQTPLYEIADRLGLDTVPSLLRSGDVKMPFAAGLARPVIVLPAESEDWSADRRSAVLVHELGHVRRRDLVGHTLGRIACALYWFHPLVWTAARRLRAESEQACDDLALSFGARPSEYAEHLLDIVTCVRDHNTPSVALAMAHRKEFEGRMLAILNPELRRRGPTRAQGASYAFALAGMALAIGAVMPVQRDAGLESRVAGHEAQDTGLVALESDSGVSTAQDTDTVFTLLKPGSSQTVSTRTDTAIATIISEHQSSSSGQVDPRRADILAKLLREDPNAETRRVAAWGLQRYADRDVAITALAGAVGGDADAEVREMAAWALADAPARSAAEAALIKALQDDDASVRSTALWALGNMGDAASVDELTALLRNANPENRQLAAWAIGNAGPAKAPAALVSLLTDQNRDVRLTAAWALYNISDVSTADALDAALRAESDRDVQIGMIRALGAMGDQAVGALERLLSSSDSSVRSVVISALADGDASGPWPWPRPRPRPFP